MGRIQGFPAFTLVWAGQLISVLATQMSGFALSIWIFERTNSATALGLSQVFFITPFLIISPIAGAMVDRYDRKWMMALSDLSAGVATLALLGLQAFGSLEVWHLYAAALLQGLGNAFQWPAYSAAISLMVPKEQLGRANGMMSLIEAGPAVIAPFAAGALLPFIGLTGVLTVDVVTFVLAVASLVLVVIPPAPVSVAGAQARGSIWSEAAFGFRYIFARPGLLGLQLVFFTGNLLFGMIGTLAQPFILSRTGNDALALGTVMGIGAIGGVGGAVLMSAWGGFKRRVHGIFGGWIVAAIGMAIVGLSTSIAGWIVGAIVAFGVGPIMNASSQAIWQSKVEPDVQGRVFSARRLISWFASPISPIIAGLLADRAFEPAMQPGGILVPIFGGLVSVGPGAGMAVLFIILAALTSLVGIAGYSIPAVREVETRLPDALPTTPQ
ncbi:MAG: MFS transporter [Anaerolineales bacterium]|nr:MFS transporter [Anaerolineales bacterium]